MKKTEHEFAICHHPPGAAKEESMAGLIDKSVLTGLCSVFSDSAIEVLDAFFSKKFEMRMPWEIVDQLQCQFDRILTLGASSPKFRAICCAGIQDDSLKTFAGMEELTNKDACDILGEFCNCYQGVLCGNSRYLKIFGILEQAVPVLYTEGHSYLPFISGTQGYLYHGRHWIYIGYSICHQIESDSAAKE